VAKDNNRIGSLRIDPLDRKSARPEETIWTASEAMSVRPRSRPRSVIPPILHAEAFFSSARATNSSVLAFAAEDVDKG
jgi:hypothetical protein